MNAQSYAIEENGQLKTFNFCSTEHMMEFTGRRGISLGKD